MKQETTRRLEEILKALPSETRRSIERNIDAVMYAIACEKVNWKEFKVYEPSTTPMIVLLKSFSGEYLVEVADKAQTENIKDVKIIINIGKETEIDCIHLNAGTGVLCIINISKRRYAAMQKRSLENFSKE